VSCNVVVITSAKGVTFLSLFVGLSVCLFVSLSVSETTQKVREIFRGGGPQDKKLLM